MPNNTYFMSIQTWRDMHADRRKIVLRICWSARNVNLLLFTKHEKIKDSRMNTSSMRAPLRCNVYLPVNTLGIWVRWITLKKESIYKSSTCIPTGFEFYAIIHTYAYSIYKTNLHVWNTQIYNAIKRRSLYFVEIYYLLSMIATLRAKSEMTTLYQRSCVDVDNTVLRPKLLILS